ncbi:guanylate kinase-like protein [Aureococcus anophagefferens]|nr:guanylate kinase-like protein [Aureococcus anophagefferens]
MATQTLSPRAQAEDDAIVPDAQRSHAEDVLSFQEISHLNDRKVSLKDSHFGYLQQHPELRSILADFTAAVLLEKPMKIFPFAAEHFAGLAQSPESGPPMLVRGSPARHPAPEAKAAARRPRARCRPTRGRRRRDMITADAEAGKYLETGPEPEAEGELIGTTLEAITRIKAMGAVPLLHVSYERAVAARTCEKVNPPPCTVLVCEDAEPPAGANFNFNTIITNGNSDKVLDALVAAVEKYYPDRVPV